MKHRHYLTPAQNRAEVLQKLKACAERPITPELAAALDVDPDSVVKTVGSDQRGAFVELEPMGFFTTSKGAA